MTTTLALPDTRQDGSASRCVDTPDHAASAQATPATNALNATATGPGALLAWLQDSAQTVRSAVTTLREEASQHLAAHNGTTAKAIALGKITLQHLSTAAEEVHSFLLAETTQTLLSNTVDSCIALSNKAFQTIAQPLAKLPAQTSDASDFVLKWAATAIPGSRVLCSAALAKLQDLGSTLWQVYQKTGTDGAEKSPTISDFSAFIDRPAAKHSSATTPGSTTAKTPDSPGLDPGHALLPLTQRDSMGANAGSHMDNENNLQSSLTRSMPQDLPLLPTETAGCMGICESFEGATAPLL